MIFLRSYQKEACDSFFKDIDDGYKRLLIVMATGTGKTTVFSEIASKFKSGRVLVISHRKEIIDQAAERLHQYTGELIGVDKAEQKSTFQRIIVGSIQTVSKDSRLNRIDRLGRPKLIIVDEAHHSTASTYLRVFQKWPDAIVLGLTATPDRGDGKALGSVFDKVSYRYDMHNAIEDGYLVPFMGKRINLSVNLDNVKMSHGDFAQGMLDREMVKQAEAIAQGSMRSAGDMQGIIFCPGVQTAHYVAERLNVLKPGCAESIDGKTESVERENVISAFRAGKLQWICNCMVFTEGTDLPTARVISMARPTRSRALYTQCVGRGGRPLPGTVDDVDSSDNRRTAINLSDKPFAVILDFVGASSHSLAAPEDLLGGEFTDEEVEYAKKIPKEREESEEDLVDPMETLKLARAELKKLANAVKAKVEMQVFDFDPMVDSGIQKGTESYIPETKRNGLPPTKKQVNMLKSLGLKPQSIEILNKNTASKVIDRAMSRNEAGLATFRQMSQLSKYGAAFEGVTKKNATKAISYIVESNWGKSTDAEKVKSIARGENN